MPDAEIMNELYFRVKKLYQKEKGAFPDPIVNLTWEYGEKDEHGKVKHLDVHKVAMEINGYYLDDVYDKKADPSEADRQERGPGTELREPAGRRIHVERELALQRELHPEGRKGRQHDGPQGEGGPDRPRPLSELGVGMAAEPEDHLQPGFRRPERESLGPEPPGDQMEPGGPRDRETGRMGRRCPRRAGSAVGERKGRETALSS